MKLLEICLQWQSSPERQRNKKGDYKMFTNILLILLILIAFAIFGELVKICEQMGASNIERNGDEAQRNG